MSFKARYVQKGESIDYTPTAAVSAGDVVFIGDVVGIAKLDIDANTLGALAIKGVFEFVKATGSAITVGTACYWDSTNACVTTTANAYYLGVTVAAAASTDTLVRVVINEGTSDYSAE